MSAGRNAERGRGGEAPRKRLVLFDIDGTLIHSGGAGSRALSRALEDLFGVKDALTGVRLNGQTDPQIVRDALERCGLDGTQDPSRLSAIESLYLQYLAKEMVVSEGARVLPGVLDLLAQLRATPGVYLALLTGNFEVGARIKLARFDLNHYFEVGAFGSDASDRPALVPLALERASAVWGTSFTAPDAVVVGDTERDVACGKAHGVRCIAVATGGVARAVLEHAGADRVFETMAAPDFAAAILTT